MRTILITLHCVLLAAVSFVSAADDATRDKMRALDRERHEVERKLRDEIREIEKSDAVASHRKAAEKCSKAYREAVEKNRGVIAARKSEDRARDEFRAVVAKKMEGNPDAKKIRARLEKLENQRMDLEHRKNLTRLRLTDHYSPIQRQLKKDAKLQEMKKRIYGLKKTEDRIRAMREYRDAEKKALEKIPEARILLGQIMQTEGRVGMVEKSLREVREKAEELRIEIERSEDPDILKAKKRCQDARNAMSKAYEAKDIQEARKKELDARRTLREKVQKLAANNPKCKPLIRKIADLRKRRDALRK